MTPSCKCNLVLPQQIMCGSTSCRTVKQATTNWPNHAAAHVKLHKLQLHTQGLAACTIPAVFLSAYGCQQSYLRFRQTAHSTSRGSSVTLLLKGKLMSNVCPEVNRQGLLESFHNRHMQLLSINATMVA